MSSLSTSDSSDQTKTTKTTPTESGTTEESNLNSDQSKSGPTEETNLNYDQQDSNASMDDFSSLEDKYNDGDDDLDLTVKPNLTVDEIFARGIEEWKKAREEVKARRLAEGRASRPGPPLPRSMQGPLYDPHYDAGFDKVRNRKNKLVYTTYVARSLVSARRPKALRTNRRTDQRSDGRTNTLSYRVAYSKLITRNVENFVSMKPTN